MASAFEQGKGLGSVEHFLCSAFLLANQIAALQFSCDIVSDISATIVHNQLSPPFSASQSECSSVKFAFHSVTIMWDWDMIDCILLT